MSRLSTVALVSAVVLGAIPVPAARPQTPPPGASPAPPAPRRTLDQLRSDLREAQATVRSVTDRKTRDRLELLLSRAELRAAELNDALTRTAAARPAVRTVAPADFEGMLGTVKSKPFDRDRVTFLEALGKEPRFTATQAAAFLKTFTFDPDRLRAADLLRPLVVDPENVYRLAETFTFDSTRNTFLQQLKAR